MAMSGSDYSKRLNDSRNEYLDSLTKVNRDHKREIDNLNKRNEYVQNKQQENYTESRKNLENSYQDRVESIGKSTQDALEAKQKVFDNKLKSEREEFIANREATSQDFNKRFNDATSEYQKVIDKREKHHNEITKQQSENYSNRLGKIENEFQESVDSLKEQATGSGNKMTNDFLKAKSRLVADHQNDKQEMIEMHTKQNNQLKEKIATDVGNIRKAHSAETEQIRDNAHNNNKVLKTKHDQEMLSSFDRFKAINNDLVEQQKNQNVKLNNIMKDRIADLNSEHSRDLKEMQNKFRMTANGEDANIEEFQKLKESESVKRHYDRKIASHRQEVDNLEKEYVENNSKMATQFDNSMKESSLQFAGELEKVRSENNALRLEDRIDFKKKITEAEDKFTSKSQIETQNFESEAARNQYLQRQKVDKLKKHFNKTIDDMQMKNEVALEDVKVDAATDKKSFVNAVNERSHVERKEMRKEFKQKINSTVNTYEREMDKLRAENELLKKQMATQIELTRQAAQEQISKERETAAEKNTQDMQAMNELRETREAALQTKINDMHAQFTKKLNDINYQSNLKLETLTRDYEMKLSNQRNSYETKLGAKEKIRQSDEKRYKHKFETQRQQIITQFEGKMKSMKEGYESQIENLKNYNRLQKS